MEHTRSADEGEAGTDKRVAAEQDGTLAAGRRLGQRREPGVAHGVVAQEVAREAVLGRRPARFVRAEPVREEDAAVEEGAVGELRHDIGQGRGTPEGEEATERCPWWAPDVRCCPPRAQGQRCRGAQPSFLGQEADPTRDVPLEPGQGGRRAAAEDEQLACRVARQVPQLIQARHADPCSLTEATQDRWCAWMEGGDRDVERRVEIEGQPPPSGELSDPESRSLREPAGQRIVGGERRQIDQRARVGDGAHVRRVAVVRERGASGLRRRGHQPPRVGHAQQRHGSRPKHHEPLQPALTDHVHQAFPEGAAGPRYEVDAFGSGPLEEPAVALSQLVSGAGEEGRQRWLVEWGGLAEDEQVDAGHRGASLGERVMAKGLVRSYVGLGANLGAARATLEAAVAALAVLPGTDLRGVSALYRTWPVGPIDQPRFHNAVAALDVPGGGDPDCGALALLSLLKSLERAHGRRPGVRWGPRALDLDLLLFGLHSIRVERPTADRSDDPSRSGAQWLEVPHPHLGERLFVLAPLADLAPDLVPPGSAETVESMRQRLAGGDPGAVELVGRWQPPSGGWS